MKDWNGIHLNIGCIVKYKLKIGAFQHEGKVYSINEQDGSLILSTPYKQKIYLSDCQYLEKISM